MLEQIHEQISVVTVYNRVKGTVMPWKIKWQGRVYTITKLGYYHKRKVGKTVLHVFDVTDNCMSFRLLCNPETLHWTLEEVSDGLAN